MYIFNSKIAVACQMSLFCARLQLGIEIIYCLFNEIIMSFIMSHNVPEMYSIFFPFWKQAGCGAKSEHRYIQKNTTPECHFLPRSHSYISTYRVPEHHASNSNSSVDRSLWNELVSSHPLSMIERLTRNMKHCEQQSPQPSVFFRTPHASPRHLYQRFQLLRQARQNLRHLLFCHFCHLSPSAPTHSFPT